MIQIHFTWLAIFGALDPGTRTGFPCHQVTEFRGVWQHGRKYIARCYFHISDRNLLCRIKTKIRKCLKPVNEICTKSVLERHAIALNLTRHQQHFFVLNIHTLDGPNAFRKMEYLGLAKAIRCEDSARLFPYQWWVQTFFNRCPD